MTARTKIGIGLALTALAVAFGVRPPRPLVSLSFVGEFGRRPEIPDDYRAVVLLLSNQGPSRLIEWGGVNRDALLITTNFDLIPPIDLGSKSSMVMVAITLDPAAKVARIKYNRPSVTRDFLEEWLRRIGVHVVNTGRVVSVNLPPRR
jgi:hypothetical protein